MKAKELKQLDEQTLRKKLAELRFNIIKEDAKAAGGSAKNPGQVRQMKKTIAKILTILKTKEVKKV